MNIDEEIAKLEKELKKLQSLKKFLDESESGCISCDFAVAAGWCASCYDDEQKGEKMK